MAKYWKGISNDTLFDLCRKGFEKKRSQQQSLPGPLARCLGRLFLHRGDYAEALVYFNDELSTARLTGDHIQIAEALNNISWCHRFIDEFEKAIETAKEALTLFEKVNDQSGQGRSLSVIGMSYWHRQEDENALRFLNQAKRIVEKNTDMGSRALVNNHLGIVYRSVGLFDKAIRHLRDAEEIFRKINDQKGLGKCLNSIGTCEWWRGNIAEALSRYRDANNLNAELDNQYVLALTANNLGYIHLETQRPKKAREQFQKAFDIRERLGIESYRMMDLSGLARAYLALGDRSKAMTLSSEAVDSLKQFDTVEDLRRAFYNHYLIFRDGSADDRRVANDALKKAKQLVNDRLARINDPALRRITLAVVPLMKEITEAVLQNPVPD